MTKTVRRVDKKKKSLALDGYFFAAYVHTPLIRYSMTNAVRPTAASSLVRPRCFRVLMMTLYVDSRVEKPLMPIIPGT